MKLRNLIGDIFGNKARRHKNNPMKPQEPFTGASIGDMTTYFNGLYALPRDPHMIHHDAVHVMTGLGIGIPDELRIVIIETSLRDKTDSVRPDDAIDRALRNLNWALKDKGESERSQNMKSSLQSQEMIQAQQTSGMLAIEEISKLFILGQKMRTAVYDLTGKHYMDLSGPELASLQSSRLDFSAEVLAIKNAHETPENRAVGVKIAKILRDNAKEEGWGLSIPRANGTWLARMPKGV